MYNAPVVLTERESGWHADVLRFAGKRIVCLWKRRRICSFSFFLFLFLKVPETYTSNDGRKFHNRNVWLSIGLLNMKRNEV